MDLLEQALHYRNIGLRPIPLRRDGEPGRHWKEPNLNKIPGWLPYKINSPTEEEVVRWFGDGVDANIGSVIPQGIIIVDFDGGEALGRAGGKRAEAMLNAHGVVLPENAPRVMTGNGYQVYLTVEHDFQKLGGLQFINTNGAKPFVEILTNGNYGILPPSVHPSGRNYEWIVEPDEIPPAPKELLDLIERFKNKGTTHGQRQKNKPGWVEEAMRGVEYGSIDDTCAKLAGFFIKGGMTPDAAIPFLYETFGKRCTNKGSAAPMRLEDVRRVVNSIHRGHKTRHVVDEAPFRCLGHAEGLYFYLPAATGQVVSLAPASHNRLNLMALVHMDYWNKKYATEGGGVAWNKAAADMMRECAQKGVFNPYRIRGRGVWFEDGKPVLHLGDGVIVDGIKRSLQEHRSDSYVYPASVPISVDLNKPLTAKDAVRLTEICEGLNWDRPISARLLSGWMALAPICGALAWRPHIWLTGAAGTGKSWVMDNIMRPVVGPMGLFVQSDTTEAGIRQALGYDARPVLFDEAEGESERAQARMQNVMALMRQSSSESGSVIVKGTASGNVKVYCVRSCFAFSSIGVGIRQHSDSTRVTVLSLKRDDTGTSGEKFAHLRKTVFNVLTKDWISGLHARMINLIPVLRANAETFARVGASQIGSQRIGDQIGALLAGAYALHSDKEITENEASIWMAKQDWSEQAILQETSDEVLCFQRIMQHLVRFSDNGKPQELSVAEMIDRCNSSPDGYSDTYMSTLLRMGLRVEPEHIIIANQHSGIANILSGTPWGDWGRVLRRLDGATPTTTPVRFAGTKVRGTKVPMPESLIK